MNAYGMQSGGSGMPPVPQNIFASYSSSSATSTGKPLAQRKTARDRTAYIARHRVNENHGDPLTPGALSRWLLWGESRSLARNTAAFRRRFRLQ